MKNRRKFISHVAAVLAVLMPLSALPVFAANKTGVETVFSDISPDDWFYEDVQYMYDNEIMTGSGLFRTEAPLTRANVVSMLYQIAGEPITGNYFFREQAGPFTDVKIQESYGRAVEWAYYNGIVSGRTENKFAPNKSVSRAEFAAILWRYVNADFQRLPVVRDKYSFTDADEIPEYAREAVDSLYRAGIINGRDGGRFDPYASITRTEGAAMLHRFLEATVHLTKDEYLTFWFYGTSYTLNGNTPIHFRRLSDCTVETVGTYLYTDYARERMDDFDIVIYQFEFPFYERYYRDYTDATLRYMTEYGLDKTYYGFQSHSGFAPDGSESAVTFGDFFKEVTYEDLLAYKKSMTEIGMVNSLVLGGIAPYDPELDINDFFIWDNETHPTALMGYCIALALYCEIFDVKAVDQNNGALMPSDIPGDTPEEKDAYMVKIKETVQKVLDMQH